MCAQCWYSIIVYEEVLRYEFESTTTIHYYYMYVPRTIHIIELTHTF